MTRPRLITVWLAMVVGSWLLVGVLAWGVTEAWPASKCASVRACRTEIAHKQQAIRWERQQHLRVQKQLAIRWQPNVVAAIRLASNVSGVSFQRLWTISGCESTHNPLDVLGQYQGLFQLGRYHRSFPDLRGLSPFDPYANAMHAALFIARHGESQWSCRSDGSVAY